MTALQWIVKEAKKIKKEYPKRFAKWTDYVAQASAIYSKKHKGHSPVGKKKKSKVGNVKSMKYVIEKDGKFLTGLGGNYKFISNKEFAYVFDSLDKAKTLSNVYGGKVKNWSSIGAVKKKKAAKNVAHKKPHKKSPARSLHKDTKSHNVNIRVMSGIGNIGENFTRVNNDVNGNPRYVVHFLDVINTEERISIPFHKLYEYAVKKAKKIGGKKFDNKSYGGGIVFQSYNIENTWHKIQELKHTHPKIKI